LKIFNIIIPFKMNEQIYPGPSQMAKIDGSKVRSLREAKGLTQLYIATVVGVTTDTISRWENKRYPSIKEENALKLAEALEVPLDEILEKEEEIVKPEETPTAVVSRSKQPKSNRILLWLMLLVVFLLLPFAWYHFQKPEPITIFATRLLPPHIPGGQPFPVIIQVRTKLHGPFSLILRETLPADCEPIVSSPPFTGMDKKTGSLKWITRTNGQVTTFVYLARKLVSESSTPDDTSLRFSGSVTLRDKKSSETTIAGSLVLPLAAYHWADANKDNRIEDDEILAVYDTFSALDNVEYDWQEIDDIWSGEGYRWDGNKKEFVILQ
jgi:transcriptional regulator with XRE-family HTH domain